MKIQLCGLKKPRGVVIDGDVKFFNNGDIIEVKDPKAYIKAGIAVEVKRAKKKSE